MWPMTLSPTWVTALERGATLGRLTAWVNTAARLTILAEQLKAWSDIAALTSTLGVMSERTRLLARLPSPESILSMQLADELLQPAGERTRRRIGEYGPTEPAVLRGHFLRAVFDVEPQSVSHLLFVLLPDCPVDAWQRLPSWCLRRGLFFRAVFEDYFEGCDLEPKVASALGSIPNNIKEWGKRWYLTDDWCFEGALALMAAIGTPLFLNFFTVPSEPGQFLFQHRGWKAGCSTTWPAFKAEVLADVNRSLKAYRTAREAETRADGSAKTPKKRSREHYRWLAGYQVCGWSKNAIALATDKDRAGVIRAIDHLAGEIGLTLRPTASNNRNWTAAKIRACLNSLPVT